MSNPRKAAVDALIKINNGGGYSNLVVKQAVSDSRLSERDAALTGAIVYGVTERKLTLDKIISDYSKVKPQRLSQEVIEILRSALYQLVFMDKIPDSAAVNEAVKLTSVYRQKSASGFVNAVLRAFIRDGKKIKLPDEKDFLQFCSIKYSCPKWLVKVLRGQYGEKLCEDILKSSLGRPPIYARVNTTKTTVDNLCKMLEEEEIEAKPFSFINNCIELKGTGAIENLKSFKEGLFHIQDGASQLCCLMSGAEKNNTVIDVCAAPGGKSFTVAQMVGDGKVLSFDIYEHKVKLIQDGANRLGLKNITADLRNAAEEDEFYKNNLLSADLVLCDVPCSGFGIIRRKPDIKYKDKESIKELVPIQRRILDISSKMVKPGGLLVYSTCTLLREENGENVRLFLSQNSDFQGVELKLPIGIEHSVKENAWEYTMIPEKYGTDGFYFAVLKRGENFEFSRG